VIVGTHTIARNIQAAIEDRAAIHDNDESYGIQYVDTHENTVRLIISNFSDERDAYTITISRGANFGASDND
jgi:hypothetical protein